MLSILASRFLKYETPVFRGIPISCEGLTIKILSKKTIKKH
jgi:hypothetical protein